jgi:hypothetical protein
MTATKAAKPAKPAKSSKDLRAEARAAKGKVPKAAKPTTKAKAKPELSFTEAPKPKPIRKYKAQVEHDSATPAPKRTSRQPKQASKVAAEIQAATSNALPRPMKVRQEHPEIQENQGGNLKWAEEAFWAFFGDEIEQMASYPAEIFNDRAYSWRCECCDVALRVPRRTTVFHGDYEVVHDDHEGLLVNGERHMPGAYTSGIEVVQPGRLKNPWTGKLIEGKSLGTTGVA